MRIGFLVDDDDGKKRVEGGGGIETVSKERTYRMNKIRIATMS